MGARTSLAWLTLAHDRRRFAASVCGVAFAVFLMLAELGFLHAIYDSSTLWLDAFDADLIMVGRLKDDMNPPNPFPRERLAQVRGAEHVRDAAPVYFSRLGKWSTHGVARQDLIRVLGVDPARATFRDPELERKRAALKELDTALVDRRVRDTYGGLRAGLFGELRGRRIHLIDDFELGPDLQMNANLVVGDQTFRRCFQHRGGPDPLAEVEFGLIRLSPGASPEDTARRLAQGLPEDVRILTPQALKDEIHGFWTLHQPVGAVFGVGLVVGFFIGLIICYQVLFTDVIDHLPQFSTLKAMGYPGGFLVGLALQQGVLIAGAALIVGLPVGWLAFSALQEVTGLVFRLTPGRVLTVVVATLLMCCIAARLAMHKALRADPAEVF